MRTGCCSFLTERTPKIWFAPTVTWHLPKWTHPLITLQMCSMVWGEITYGMENSPKLESMPTLGRSATLPPRNHHFKKESRSNYETASSVAHQRDINFQGINSIRMMWDAEMRTTNGKNRGMTITRMIERAYRAHAMGVWWDILDKMDYFWCILRHFGRHLKANFQPTTVFSSTKCPETNKYWSLRSAFTDLRRCQTGLETEGNCDTVVNPHLWGWSLQQNQLTHR